MAFTEKYFGKGEHRKPHKGSKRFDHTCRNHGTCGYCQGNRTYFDKKYRDAADNKLNEWTS